MRRSHSTPEACEATGLTFRQLDYWHRTGRITPAVPAAGPGSRVRWSAAQVEFLTAVADRIAAGLTLDAAFDPKVIEIPPLPALEPSRGAAA